MILLTLCPKAQKIQIPDRITLEVYIWLWKFALAKDNAHTAAHRKI